MMANPVFFLRFVARSALTFNFWLFFFGGRRTHQGNPRLLVESHLLNGKMPGKSCKDQVSNVQHPYFHSMKSWLVHRDPYAGILWSLGYFFSIPYRKTTRDFWVTAAPGGGERFTERGLRSEVWGMWIKPLHKRERFGVTFPKISISASKFFKQGRHRCRTRVVCQVSVKCGPLFLPLVKKGDPSKWLLVTSN